MGQKNTTAFFLTLLGFSLVIFLLDRNGALAFLHSAVEQIVSPGQRGFHSILLPKVDEKEADLAQAQSELKKLEKENEDLRSQLSIGNQVVQKLLLAHVLSTGRFFVIDKGSDDGIEVGQSVAFKNILVGRIIGVSKHVSRVLLPSEKESVLQAASRETGAKGLIKGEGDDMVFSEVILSEKLTEGDTIETVGNVDEKGLGILPHLLIGKVGQVRKSDNQLFQEAKIVPLLELKNLEDVFVLE